MRRKIYAFLCCLLCPSIYLNAQEKPLAWVKGNIQNEANSSPAADVQIIIPYLKILTVTDAHGDFLLNQVPFGTHRLIVRGANIASDTISIYVNKEGVDIGSINIRYDEAALAAQDLQMPTMAMENADDGDDEYAGAVSSILTASRDPFLNTAAFVFGSYRFQMRGYDRSQQQLFINGAPMNDVETNDAYWSQWGGLNDVFRNRNNTYGLGASDYAFGGINGTTVFDATAASQRRQTRITYSLTNRQYRNRIMLTHSSGLNKNGWAYSVSFSKRWAEEGYVPGTFYDGYSYYAAVSKRIKKKHDLHLTVFGAPAKRGKAAPSFAESYDVLGTHFYNPNWGWQDGKKRNAKVANIHQPVLLLNYEHHFSESFRWNTTLGYQFGKNKNSTLDWYNASDPRPDYYKYLPSYTINDKQQYPNISEEQKLLATERFVARSQIQWEELYEANKLNDGRSLYVINDDVDAMKKWIFNTQLLKALNEHVSLQTGISVLKQNTESYRQMNDLLGGDYFLNVNSFTERNFINSSTQSQNDLNHPNQKITVGDKYFYHYKIDFLKAGWWGQAQLTYNKMDLFLGAAYGIHSVQREGLFKNGLFADDSYGKSKRLSFNTYGLKGGITYKLNGRHYLFANGAYIADAPTVDNTWFSARVRNTVVENPTVQKTASLEAGYLLRAPKTNIRAVGYATQREDAVEVQRFFYQGTGSANSMVAYVLQGVNIRYMGLELAIDYKLSSAFSATAVAAMGQAFYISDPVATIHQENAIDSPVIKETAYLNNTYLGIGPQSAYTLGVNYRSKNYWYVNINFNYFDRNYIDPAAPRRTAQALEGIEQESDQWHSILDQEKLPSVFTIDLFLSKSVLLSKSIKSLPRNTYLYLNVGISNLLNNKSIATGGFENVRFDYGGADASKFASKYFYGFGRNYFINLSLKF